MDVIATDGEIASWLPIRFGGISQERSHHLRGLVARYFGAWIVALEF